MKHKNSEFVNRIPPSGIRKIFDAANQMDDVMHLEIGEPDFPTPPHVIEAACKAARDGSTHYTPTSGIPELREVIASKLCSDSDIEVDPSSEIVVTVGAVNAILAVCLTILDPGDEVILTDPCWPNYFAHINMAKAVPVSLPLRQSADFQPDLDELRSKVTQKTKMIILNTPNNPCGSVLSKDTLKGIGHIALEHDLVVLADEVYEKILFDGNIHFSLGSIPEFKQNVVTVNSLSKTYAMTGWRLGYAAGPKSIIAGVNKIQQSSISCASSVSQKAAIAALTGPQDVVKDMVKTYAKRRKLITEGLKNIPGISVCNPGGAFYVFPSIEKFDLSSSEFAMSLLKEARIAVVPGSGLGDFGEGHVRISFSVSDSVIVEALKRLEDWVKNFRGK